MQIKIAVLLFGFIRDVTYIERAKTRISNLIIKTGIRSPQIDFFYSCPDRVNEFDLAVLDQAAMNLMFKAEFGDALRVNYRPYDPITFIRECIQLKLPIINSENHYCYRLLSQVYSISETAKLIDVASYDTVLMTRLDIIPNVQSLGLFNHNGLSNLYIYRVSPERSNEMAEDRIFWGCPSAFKQLCNYYSWALTKNLEATYPEKLLLDFFSETKSDIGLEFQEDVEISTKVFVQKYSLEYYQKIIELYKSVDPTTITKSADQF